MRFIVWNETWWETVKIVFEKVPAKYGILELHNPFFYCNFYTATGSREFSLQYEFLFDLI